MDKHLNIGVNFLEPVELVAAVGRRAKELRLSLGRRQADVAAAAGVPLSTLRRFEASGQTGFEVVARIAVALQAERQFGELFPPRDLRSLDEVLRGSRKRARARRKS